MLMVEMNLPREERRTPAALLKDVKDQYDRLQEISPLLPPEIVNVFRRRFDHQTDISKPEETNGLENISVYPVSPNVMPTPSQHVQNATAFQLKPPRPAKPHRDAESDSKEETSVEIFTTE
jgi:hypothetical protein